MRVKVDIERMRRTLIGAAKRDRPSEAVPYAFEQRVMARLRSPAPLNGWLAWGHALWRAAAACVMIATLCSVWSFWPVSEVEAATLESTVLAGADELEVW